MVGFFEHSDFVIGRERTLDVPNKDPKNENYKRLRGRVENRIRTVASRCNGRVPFSDDRLAFDRRTASTFA